MIELALNNIQKYYGATMVIENINFEIKTGEKVGIVGRNGSGKTTILKIITGLEKQDKGDVFIKKDAAIGYLDQIPTYPEYYRVLDVLNSAFEKQRTIYEEMNALEIEMTSLKDKALETAIKKYGDLQTKYETIGGYRIEESMSKVCMGLKIAEDFKERLFCKLSGGEKTTVILAKILLQNPDILLLDEPSNHLDLESMEWLENYLINFKGSVLIVSHDRYFLDKVATKIVEIEDMCSETYSGNYSNYVKEKENNLLLQFQAYEDQQKKIKAMERTIKDLRDWGLRSDNKKFFRRAASIQKRLDKMQRIDRPSLDNPQIKLDLSASDRSGNEVIKVNCLAKAFENKVLLENADMLIRYGERAAFIGNNGTGKSTLIKILLKEINADSGTAVLGSSVKLGYLPQNITFSKEDATVLECFRANINILEGKAREYLSKFLFYGESVFKKVKNLSGGEKVRLKLCELLYNDINLLILDEPTNHLDIDSREAMEDALSNFQGTILFISHDRYFINRLCTRIVELYDKKLICYEGNYEYFKIKKEEKKKLMDQTENTVKKNAAPKSVKKIVPSSEKNNFQLKKIEEKIQQLENMITKISEEMNLYADNYDKINKLYIEKSEAENLLEKYMEEWLQLS